MVCCKITKTPKFFKKCILIKQTKSWRMEKNSFCHPPISSHRWRRRRRCWRRWEERGGACKASVCFPRFVIDLFWLFFHVELRPYSETFLSFSSTSYLLVSRDKYFFPSRDKSCEPIFAPFSASESSAAAATTTAMTMTTLRPPLVDVGGGGEKPSGGGGEGGEYRQPRRAATEEERPVCCAHPLSLSLPPSFPLRRVIFFFPRVWSGLNNGKVRRRKSLHWGRPPEPKRARVCVR